MSEPTKVCTKCKLELSLSEFYHKAGGMLGVTSRCKICFSQIASEHRKANLEEVREKSRMYRNKNIEKVREYEKRYRDSHIEEERKRSKKYYETHPEKSLERARRYREKYPREARVNRERERKWSRCYRKEHPERIKKARRKTYLKTRPISAKEKLFFQIVNAASSLKDICK